MAIANLSPTGSTQKGPTCKVCQTLARLEVEDPTEAEALTRHLSNPEWRFTDLADALFQDSGGTINLPEYCLSRHARGQCAARTKLR